MIFIPGIIGVFLAFAVISPDQLVCSLFLTVLGTIINEVVNPTLVKAFGTTCALVVSLGIIVAAEIAQTVLFFGATVDTQSFWAVRAQNI